MTANMYRVGDYVYFETPNSNPYHIRRIEELNKAPNGNVEAKVMCFFRRRDLPSSLVMLADKHHQGTDGDINNTDPCWGTNNVENDLSKKQKYQLKHRELFLSRRVETLPAASIRGKCCVTLLNENESLLSYLNTDDMFFYCLVFDPLQKTLLADKGEIRVGSRFQADIPSLLESGESDPRPEDECLETLTWISNHSLTDEQIDQFLVISRSVGTFARSLDCSSSIKQPSLHMSAAAASRDITLFHAMDTLHKHNYDIAAAISSLVPATGPVLCRDEMEEWSASEANLFEEALEKYGKEFIDIRKDFIPWKTLKNIVEYYYMWKTTDRYVQQKRVKAVEAESKLKQVYVPNYVHKVGQPTNLNNKNMVNGTNSVRDFYQSNINCELCSATTNQWYLWNVSGTQCKLCYNCWVYWKKYGGFKQPHKFVSENDIDVYTKKKSDSDDEKQQSTTHHRPHKCSIVGCEKEFKLKPHLVRHYQSAHGISLRTGSPRPIMKTRNAFWWNATISTKASRRLCSSFIPPRHVARKPFLPINVTVLKQECQMQLAGKSLKELKELSKCISRERDSVTRIATRLAQAGNYELVIPKWLEPTHRDKLPRTEFIAFPKPPKGPDGSLLYERIPNAIIDGEKHLLNHLSSGHKRRYDEMNGVVIPQVGPPSKRVHKDPFVSARSKDSAGNISGANPPSAMTVSSSALMNLSSIGGGGGGLPAVPINLPISLMVPPSNSVSMSSSATSSIPMSLTVNRNISPVNPVVAMSPPLAVPPVTSAGIIVPSATTAAAAAALISSNSVTVNHLHGQSFRSRGGLVTRTGRKHVVSWMDAPDDLYYRVTPSDKRGRRNFTTWELKSIARNPWKFFS